MINRLSNLLVCLLIIVMLLVVGCKRAEKAEPISPLSLESADYAVPDFASAAFEATGGRRTWTNTRSFQLDCVVTFYKQDGSFYLTEHKYRIEPWSNSIWISACEPQYKFVWHLSDEKFSIFEGAEKASPLPVALDAHHFAQALLNITTAPARFLDRSFNFTERSEPVKIEGRWYLPIERNIILTSDLSHWSKVVFYQDRDTSLVDMVWFAAAGGEKFLMVRGYDYDKAKEQGFLVPAKIEIFETDAAARPQQRLVKIDLK
jgi:hypothetical protein